MKDKDIMAMAEKYGIFSIYLFGSQARKGKGYLKGEDVIHDAFSDLDVAIAFETPPDDAMKTYGVLYKEISEIFDPFHIDLIFMHEVDTILQYEIIKGIRIYKKDEFDADEFEERIMKKAEDLLFKKRIFDDEIMEAMESGYLEFEYSPNT